MAKIIKRMLNTAFFIFIGLYVVSFIYYYPYYIEDKNFSIFQTQIEYSFYTFPNEYINYYGIMEFISEYMNGLANSPYMFKNLEYTLFFIGLYLLISYPYFLKVIKNYKYYALPYKLQNLQQEKENSENKISIFYTEHYFKKRVKNTLYYKSKITVKREDYLDYKEQICNYLGCDNIEFNFIPGTMNFTITMLNRVPLATFKNEYLKEDGICLGLDFNKEPFYLQNITHIVGGGQSGGGKTNLIEIMLLNLFNWYKNNKLEKIYIIDFKRTDLQKYKDFSFIDYYSDILQSRLIIEEIVKLTNERNFLDKNSKEMKNLKPIFLIIDEFTDLMSDKKSIELINELGRKARSAKIYLITFLQKIDEKSISTQLLNNLQTKILLKTDDDNTRNKLIGNEIIFEENNLLNPTSFNIGDIILKDGITSIYTMLKVFKFEEEYFNELLENYQVIDKTLQEIQIEINTAILRAKQNQEDIYTIKHLKPPEKDNYVKYMNDLINRLKTSKKTLNKEHFQKVKTLIEKVDERIPFS